MSSILYFVAKSSSPATARSCPNLYNLAKPQFVGWLQNKVELKFKFIIVRRTSSLRLSTPFPTLQTLKAKYSSLDPFALGCYYTVVVVNIF